MITTSHLKLKKCAGQTRACPWLQDLYSGNSAPGSLLFLQTLPSTPHLLSRFQTPSLRCSLPHLLPVVASPRNSRLPTYASALNFWQGPPNSLCKTPLLLWPRLFGFQSLQPSTRYLHCSGKVGVTLYCPWPAHHFCICPSEIFVFSLSSCLRCCRHAKSPSCLMALAAAVPSGVPPPFVLQSVRHFHSPRERLKY